MSRSQRCVNIWGIDDCFQLLPKSHEIDNHTWKNHSSLSLIHKGHQSDNIRPSPRWLGLMGTPGGSSVLSPNTSLLGYNLQKRSCSKQVRHINTEKRIQRKNYVLRKANWEEERTQIKIYDKRHQNFMWKIQIEKNPRNHNRFTILSERLQEKKREPHSRSIFTMAYTHVTLITAHFLL